MAVDFETFWAAYPKKVGKLGAQRAYQKASGLATAAAILAGLHAFLTHLPDERRFIPLATTWLNQGRWLDEYDAAPESMSTKTSGNRGAIARFIAKGNKR